MTIITTVPPVQFHVVDKRGKTLYVQSSAVMPDPNTIDHIEEPIVLAQIITKSEFIGSIMELCMDKIGIFKNQVYLTADRVELTFELPLVEIAFDFFNQIKDNFTWLCFFRLYIVQICTCSPCQTGHFIAQ